jgi:hypothetical protein
MRQHAPMGPGFFLLGGGGVVDVGGFCSHEDLIVFSSSSQCVPQRAPNSSSLYPISFAQVLPIVTYITSPRGETTYFGTVQSLIDCCDRPIKDTHHKRKTNWTLVSLQLTNMSHNLHIPVQQWPLSAFSTASLFVTTNDLGWHLNGIGPLWNFSPMLNHQRICLFQIRCFLIRLGISYLPSLAPFVPL